jgi:hypothetical protein
VRCGSRGRRGERDIGGPFDVDDGLLAAAPDGGVGVPGAVSSSRLVRKADRQVRKSLV